VTILQVERRFTGFGRRCPPKIILNIAARTTMFRLLTCVSILGVQLVITAASNQPQSFFSSNAPPYQTENFHHDPHAHWDVGLFRPLEDFSSLSDTDFTTLGHPVFPRHSVRIKKMPSGFCDDTVRFALPSCRRGSIYLTNYGRLV
jgi:hypothetical protein